MNRRQFFRAGVGAATGLMLPRRAYPYPLSPRNITKFAVGLPGLTSANANDMGNYIPVATPVPNKDRGTDYYEIAVKNFTQKLHPNLNPTRLLGYADASAGGDRTSKYLGGLIVASNGRPVQMKVKNRLTGPHPLPVDTSLMGGEKGQWSTRVTVHLHGGFVHWPSDGGPFTWFDRDGTHGPSFVNGTGVSGEAVYDYPNDQSARLMWYHDHAIGLTRLNAYAGLATGYLITDKVEADLVTSGAIPGVQIPLVIQDKTFKTVADEWGNPGDLWYPSVYERDRWELQLVRPSVPVPSVVPEFFSDIILVNGAPYPTVNVSPSRLRLRILNGSQARFYNLQMYVKNSDTLDGITLDANTNPTNADGPAFIQIGTEGGLLPAPVAFAKSVNGKIVNSNRVIGFNNLLPTDPTSGNATRYNLLLAPAERADLIIDFRPFKGQTVILYSDAPAPFPGGDPRNDYYPGAPDLSGSGGAPSPSPGSGPDTRILMQFKVGTSGPADKDFAATLAALQSALPKAYKDSQPKDLKLHRKDVPFIKTLNEDFDEYGRLRQRLGTNVKIGGGYGADYMARPTEIAKKDDVQVWRIFNLTGDTHPMHFHLVNVQVLQRARWAYTLDMAGNPIPNFRLIPGSERDPDPNEDGWKETVRMNPGEAVDVVMEFNLPKGKVDDSPRLLRDYNIKGAEYVWHCHILEHEEHDMMHTFVVT